MRSWTVLALLLFLAIGLPTNAEDTPEASGPASKVHVQIIDQETGEPVSAMLAVTVGNERRHVFHPDIGRVRTFYTIQDFKDGIEVDDPENWISEPMLIAGTGNGRDPVVYDLGSSIANWPEVVQFRVPPSFTFPLGKGSWRMPVYRGPEYISEENPFSVTGGRDISKTIELKRWINMSKEGWWSGDTHVHHPTETVGQRNFLMAYAKAVDIHVVSVLEMGHHLGTDFPQKGFGREHREHDGNTWVVSGQEDPRGKFGHVVGLNITGMARVSDQEIGHHYDHYDLAFSELHAQPGSLIGLAHFAFNGSMQSRGIHMHMATGDIDFVELLQFNKMNREQYYEFLNLGFRIAVAAGSDVPWGGTMGEVRTYVYTGPALDIDTWYRNLGAGRSFVTNGPMLTLTVNGEMPGAVVNLRAGDKVHITALARGHASTGIPDVLEIVANGEVIEQVSNAEAKETVEASLTIAPSESTWIAAYLKATNPSTPHESWQPIPAQDVMAHTSPVYLTIDGQPTWSKEHAPAVIRKQTDALTELRSEFSGAKGAREEGIVKRIDHALGFYKDLGEAIQSGKASKEYLDLFRGNRKPEQKEN